MRFNEPDASETVRWINPAVNSIDIQFVVIKLEGILDPRVTRRPVYASTPTPHFSLYSALMKLRDRTPGNKAKSVQIMEDFRSFIAVWLLWIRHVRLCITDKNSFSSAGRIFRFSAQFNSSVKEYRRAYGRWLLDSLKNN